MPQKPTYEELENRILELEPAEASLRASEARFRAIVEKSPMGIAIVNDQFQYIYVNKEFCNIAGYPEEEIINADFFFLLAEESRQLAIERYTKRQRGESVPDRYEVSFIKKNGDCRIGEVQSTVFADVDGRANSLLQVYDITDRKLSEEELQDSEKKYRILVENAGEAIFVAQGGMLKFVNPSTETIIGYPREVLISRTFTEFIHPEDRMMVLNRHMKRVQGEDVPSRYAFRIITAGGETRWVELNTVGILWENLPATLNFLSDITARRQMEDSLRKSEEKFRFLAEKMGDVVWTMDMNLRTTYVSPSIYRLLGFTPEERKRQSVDEQMPPESLVHVMTVLQQELDREREGDFDPDRTVTLEVEYYHKNGGTVWMENIVKGIRNDKGELTGLYGLSRNINERRQAEISLKKARERFQRMLDVVPDMISIHDPDMNIVYSNWKGIAAVAPEKRVLGTKCFKTYRGVDDICPDCDIKNVIQIKRPFQLERRLSDGTWMDFRVIPLLDDHGNVEFFMEWVRDITESKQAEEERQKLQNLLNQAQKMESVGRLAGGVAHDFNNMLGVILGRAELALKITNPDQPIHKSIKEIQRAAERAADLTRQLLAFARKQTISPKQLFLNETVGGMITMLRRLIGEDIHLIWMPGADLWPVRMDPAQVDQILANLCVNARDAITGVGNISIKTENIHLDEIFCLDQEDAVPGDYVLLEVSDDGCGMNMAVIDKLFEPFFTTKAVGKGTGLGLATLYGIVRQNSGAIKVTSRPGQGTTFDIYIPRDTGTVALPHAETRQKTPTGGSETILLVEDEPAILDMARLMLENLGYRILTAGSPTEAIRIAESHAEKIDLLMTDVIMPGMNGRDLAGRLSSFHPEIKTLFMSGYTADVIAHRGVLNGAVNFIQKPFSMDELAARVRNALGNPEP